MSEMFEAMERGEFRALYVLGENPLQSEADQAQTRHRLESLDLLIVQDIFLTATAEMADVVFPAAAGWCESEGTVTNSERTGPARAQGDRSAGREPGTTLTSSLISRAGWDTTGENRTPRRSGTKCASLSPASRGNELRAPGGRRTGSSGRAMTRTIRGSCSCTAGSGSDRLNGPKVAFQPVEHDPPVERLTDEFPLTAHDGPPARRVQYGRPNFGLRVAAPPR